MRPVEITIDKAPRCHWHSNCVPGRNNGIMKIVRVEPGRTVFECMHCGDRGFVPVGHSFGVPFCSPTLEADES